MEEQLKNLTVGKALLIGVGLLFGYWYFVYDDGGTKEASIVALDTQIQAAETEIASINKAVEDAERFQQKMLTLGAEMEKVLQAMPTKLSGLDLMSIISNEAKGVGAEINNLNAPESTNQNQPVGGEQKFYENVPIVLDITGTYSQVMLFLSNLTRLDKIITAEKLSMTVLSAGGTSVAPKINLKASFFAYRYIPKAKEVK